MRFKTRASGASQIMTDPKKGSKEPLSKTAQKYIRERWIADKYNRHRELTSKAIMKGIQNEEQAITALALHLGDLITKNQETRSNDYLIGTADVIHEGTVYDLKCSYDIWTFSEAEITDAYEWQLRCYMELWNCQRAALVYVLTDAPESVIDAEVRSTIWKMDSAEVDILTVRDTIAQGLTYGDIDAAEKIKIFTLERDAEKISQLYKRVELCREFYDRLTL